jgi:hypothetical protein
VEQTLTENKFAKILIGRQQNRMGLTALDKNGFIVCSGIDFSYRLNAVTVSAKAFDNLLVYIFVCDDIQLTFSKG